MNGILCILFATAAAHAWPVDVEVTVPSGDVHFERPAAVDWADVEDPKVATVELLQTGELLFTGKTPGHTYVLLAAQGKSAVWRIDVMPKGALFHRDPPSTAELDATRKVCPKFILGEPGTDEALTVTVSDAACRQALLKLFQTPAYLARELSLTYELDVLQKQLTEITDAIAKSAHVAIEVHYLGAGLVLKGQVSEAQHRQILWEVFRHTVGRVALDDELEVAPAEKKPEGATP